MWTFNHFPPFHTPRLLSASGWTTFELYTARQHIFTKDHSSGHLPDADEKIKRGGGHLHG